MYCKHCGAKIKGRRLYCQECGKKLEANSQNNTSHFYYRQRSRILAGLLAIFIGFGIYNLYIRNHKKGITQFLVPFISILLTFIMYLIADSVGSLVLVAGFFLPYILTLSILISMHLWSIVEGILILTGLIDEDGVGIILK